jgi:hypothetical protein
MAMSGQAVLPCQKGKNSRIESRPIVLVHAMRGGRYRYALDIRQ